MKRLLLPLLAALALPSAVNAKTIYLSCEFNQQRYVIDGKLVESGKKSWIKSKSNPVELTLNKNNQSGSIFYKDHKFLEPKLTNRTAKLDLVTFQPKSIIIAVVPIENNAFEFKETYTINRDNGFVLRETYSVGGMLKYD
tara:strand:- start:975 stop:1394 length:420 start_codon:yes stop_codon:yes gene_type:complete